VSYREISESRFSRHGLQTVRERLAAEAFAVVARGTVQTVAATIACRANSQKCRRSDYSCCTFRHCQSSSQITVLMSSSCDWPRDWNEYAWDRSPIISVWTTVDNSALRHFVANFGLDATSRRTV